MVVVSFDTTVRQMTEMFQWPKSPAKKDWNVSWVKKEQQWTVIMYALPCLATLLFMSHVKILASCTTSHQQLLHFLDGVKQLHKSCVNYTYYYNIISFLVTISYFLFLQYTNYNFW